MPRPFSYHHRKHLRLDLRDKRLNQGKCMNVEPDLSVYYHCFAFLVGEVKKHRVSGKKQEEKNSDGKEPQPGKSNDSGEPLAKRCKPNLGGNADSRDENYIMQKLNVDTEGVRTEQDNTCGDDASNAEKLNSKYYRHLRQEEEIQVCRYLPQLFAEMLAATAVNNPNVWIGRTNEAVQLGFGLDGLKLRFVRLVLRNCGDDERRPTIADIRNPKVRCDIFLTKEFDLFNQSHLKMFFQMLFAFTYVNDVRPHPR